MKVLWNAARRLGQTGRSSGAHARRAFRASSSSSNLLRRRCRGQSVWLDRGSSHTLLSRSWRERAEADAITGVRITADGLLSALREDHETRNAVREMSRLGLDESAIYQSLLLDNARIAGEWLRPIYDATQGRDGFVAMPVAADLALDTDGMIEDAQSLWRTLDAPNAMIVLPATEAAPAAIEELVYQGISASADLLLTIPRYEEVLDAYLRGLERRIEEDLPVSRVSSAAGFAMSAIQECADKVLQHPAVAEGDSRDCLPRLAVNSAAAAYTLYRRASLSRRFEHLARHGARPQRVLFLIDHVPDRDSPPDAAPVTLTAPATIAAMPAPVIEQLRESETPISSLLAKGSNSGCTPERLRSVEGLLHHFDMFQEDLVKKHVLEADQALDEISAVLES